MKLSRQVTVLGSAVFCVVVFSLYLMLDHSQFDQPKSPRQEGSGFPKGQLSMLQEKIDHLEQLLAQNNEIIYNIRESVLYLSENVKDSQKKPEDVNSSDGAVTGFLPPAPALLPIEPEDCQFASQSSRPESDVQMLNVYDMLPFDNPDGGVWKQGFEIKYEENEWDSEPLQVFVVPHSHNDPGWLKTFDDYFRDQTQHILNNMVIKLQENVKRKFVWSEISYFSKWWDGIDSQKKDAVKSLVEHGQLEIVTGGWVMTDEASSHYFSMIDQLIEGHQWLDKNLGVKPKSGWAVDPFGHSPTMAYLLKRSGLSNMLIQRVHYSVKKYLSTQKALEFFWRQNWDSGSSTDMFCHMMPFYSYDVPHTCGPDPKICCQFDFKRLPGGRVSCPWRVPPEEIHPGNVQHRAAMILDQYRKKSKLFRTNIVLVPLGDDFRYSDSSEWDQQFQNYQKLFDYMNSHPELHVKAQFGTLSDYFDALERAAVDQKSSKSVFPVLSGDFFTYADRDDHYWSGYFTSRPFYKRLNRVMESNLRAAEILYSLALAQCKKSNKMKLFPSAEHYKLLTEARRNLGLFQHHDAITGTAKDWVVVDYGTRLFHSLMNLKRVTVDSAHFLILKNKDNYIYNPSSPFLSMDDVQPVHDALPRKTIIKLSNHPRFLVIYNPTEQERISVVSVYVNSPKVKVLSTAGKPVRVQLSAVWDGATTASQEAYQISFTAHLPALGLIVYQLVEGMSSETVLADYGMYISGQTDVKVNTNRLFKIEEMQNAEDEITIENAYMKLQFSGLSGLLEKMKTKEDEKIHQMKVGFTWYGTTNNKDKSGAYLFLPDGEAKPYVFAEPPIRRVTRGGIFSEVTCFFHHLTHTVRLYHVQGVEGQSLEVSNIVDIRGEYNREIAMRISSDINSENRFYSDLNGYQIQPRQTMSKLPLQANVYPMTTMAYVQDHSSRFSLHTAQSLGIASFKSGQLEVIMDRRLMQDDNRGLGQGVQDNKITANLFRILLEKRNIVDKKEDKKSVSYPSLLSHMTSSFLHYPVIPMATTSDSSVPELLKYFSPLTSPMPCDMHLLNLRTIQSKVDALPSDEAAMILHRKGFDCGFENKDMGLHCSTTQGKILVHKLFKNVIIESITLSSLSLMHSLADARNVTEINMSPMEISTFRIRLR
ncbi:alpha-mannosidase 2 [Ambystoma mexicanum]|uniref:alpha-mannosidase 2 n=1 Tax=Ambystoma mexicanum TaxID=8296 RepID=UPI0037E8FDB5